MESFVRTISTWEGKTNFGKIVSIDFDGPISQFRGWKGPQSFGKIVPGARQTIMKLHREGWYINIMTTRLVSFMLVHWLFRHGIVFDDINGRCSDFTYGPIMPGDIEDALRTPGKARAISRVEIRLQSYNDEVVDYTPAHPQYFWRHNPAFASMKPIASAYIDDMNWESLGLKFTEKTWDSIYLKLHHYFDGQ